MFSAPASPDIPLLVKSADSGSERRINPSWSVAHLKTRLEPITGIPASAQKLSLRIGSRDAVPIEASDEENTQLSSFPLQAYAEIFVSRNFLFSEPDLRNISWNHPSANKWLYATCNALHVDRITMSHPGILLLLLRVTSLAGQAS
jgi:hypothetical protein